MTRATRGWFAFLHGDWRGARADLEQARALSPQTERSWFSAYAPLFLTRLLLTEGDWVNALMAAQQAIILSEWRGDLQVVRPASAVLAELDLLDGRPEVAIARLLPLLDRCGIEECDVTMLLPVLAWAHLEQGQVDQAAETVAQALTRARREDMRLIVVEALRVAAIVALCQGHRQEAAGRIEEGLELARAMPYPYAEARLLQVDGERLAAQGEPIGARKRLEEALAIFRRLGAYRETEQVERVIAAFRVG